MGAMLGISKQALSPILRRLLAKGYLTQEVNPSDRRKRVILATKLGVQLMAQLNNLQQGIFDRGFRHVGVEGMVTFFRTLAAMLEPESIQILSEYARRLDDLGQECLLKTISGVASSRSHTRPKASALKGR